MTSTYDGLKAAISDRYTIEREIGRGGMATVYLAEDVKHHRKVAVKVLRPELAAALGAERFLNEIRVTANLQHPHILPLHDSGDADGFLYYVMPYIEGESLREKLNREKQLPIDEALRITTQVADALRSAHLQGVVHRDIKPENILLREGHAMVADFGIALAVSFAGGERLTETGLSLGTPAYMSPEQVAGDREIDARTDIYSLACVLYEMLAGDPPFVASTPRAVLAKHMTDPVPPITTVRSSVPSPVRAALTKALGKAPADRFESAITFSEALFATAVEAADEKKSIVVLPFENLSPDPDNAFFADGLTEELIADLSKVRALTVISRTSAMMYKDAKKSAPTIAEELNVRYVLEGSVRRAGHNLRITAQLIDGSTDQHLWAEKYSGTLDDAFDLQEQLSRRIVEALKGALTPDEERRLATRATDDPRVYEAWMRARQVAYSLTGEGIEEGIRLINHGLEAFGDHALLHAANGVFHYFLYDFGFSPEKKTLERCATATTRALEMNPDLPQAWLAKGLSVYKLGNTPETVRHLRRVLELERNSDALWLLGFILSEAGKTDEARGYADEAVERDPLLWATRFSRAVVDLFAGEFDAAVARFKDEAERGQAEHAFSQWWVGQSLAYAGEETEAVAAFEKGSNPNSGLSSDLCELGARAFRGERERVREWFESNEGLQQAVMRDETFPRYVAQCFARVGEFDEALRWLNQAMDWGFTNHHFLAERDRGLVPLRGDPRFSAFLERARQKQIAFEV